MDVPDEFAPNYPRVSLAALPTPLDRAVRLERELTAGSTRAPRLYIKRDDLLSLGLGGNKVRSLEFSIGQALAEGATDVVTAGRPQSNHCRLTAAACARVGLRAHLVLMGRRPDVPTGNLLLDELFGAQLHFTGSDDRQARSALMSATVDDIVTGGGRAYAIPVGAADARGAVGHALAAREIIMQCEEIGARPTAIVLATATGGTQAGLMCGLRKLGVSARVWGFAVAADAEALRIEVLAIANELAGEMNVPPFAAAEVRIDGSVLGDGYGVASKAGSEAIRLLARTEGLVADPVYTGKALAGLLDAIGDASFSSDDVVVFVHTGGWPALFAELPATPM